MQLMGIIIELFRQQWGYHRDIAWTHMDPAIPYEYLLFGLWALVASEMAFGSVG